MQWKLRVTFRFTGQCIWRFFELFFSRFSGYFRIKFFLLDFGLSVGEKIFIFNLQASELTFFSRSVQWTHAIFVRVRAHLTSRRKEFTFPRLWLRVSRCWELRAKPIFPHIYLSQVFQRVSKENRTTLMMYGRHGFRGDESFVNETEYSVRENDGILRV